MEIITDRPLDQRANSKYLIWTVLIEVEHLVLNKPKNHDQRGDGAPSSSQKTAAIPEALGKL